MPDYQLELPQHPPIPQFLLREVHAKLAWVDERIATAHISDLGDMVILSLPDEPEPGVVQLLRDRVAALVKAMAQDAFDPEFRVLERHDFTGTASADPMPELLRRREVVQEGPGYFVVGPLLTKVIGSFERRLVAVAADMAAAAYRFPTLIAPEYLEKVQYFRNFPHTLSFATHLRENLPAVQAFSAAASVEDGRLCVDHDVFAPSPAALSPTVCHHLYLALAGCRLPGSGMTATATGNCFRYESKNMVSLERVWNFTMREIIFVGDAEYVRTRLDEARERIRPLLAQLQLTHQVITANDPFFIGTFRNQAAFQAAFELKFEIRAHLPYKNDSIAIGSYNRHADFFGRTLNITTADGQPAHTGCIGIGFERLAHAFVSQHGLDPARWPPDTLDVQAINEPPGLALTAADSFHHAPNANKC